MKKLAIGRVGVLATNFSVPPFSNQTVLLNRVNNLAYPNGLFNPLSYNNQVSEMLCRASNQLFKVRSFKRCWKIN